MHIVFKPNKQKYCSWNFCLKSHFLTVITVVCCIFIKCLHLFQCVAEFVAPPSSRGILDNGYNEYSCRRLRGAFMIFKQLSHSSFNYFIVFYAGRLMSRHNNYLATCTPTSVISLQVQLMWVYFMTLNALQVSFYRTWFNLITWLHAFDHCVVVWWSQHAVPVIHVSDNKFWPLTSI